MVFHCTNQNVLITGSGSGLGRLFSFEFARRNCVLILWDIRLGLIEETRDLVQKERPETKIILVQCDLSKRENIYAAADETLQQVGEIDIIVNNAGVVSGKTFLDTPDHMIELTMNVNAMAHMWMAKKFLPPMIERNRGYWITIASAAATTGVPGLADYCASKSAAFGFHESIRLELRKNKKEGVKTLCICPYYINTGMFDGVKTKFSFILPILDPLYVVARTMSAMEKEQEMICLPESVYLTWLFRLILPVRWQDYLSQFLGLTSTMDDFKGRGTDWMLGKPHTLEHTKTD